MDERTALQMFEKTGAIMHGHFVYTSEKHGGTYVNKDAVYAHPPIVSAMCHAIALGFIDDNIEVVVGPAMGGIILSQYTALHLASLTGKPVHAVFVENSAEGFIFKRGYDTFVRGKRALVVEDILNEGRSAKRTVAVCRRHQAEIIAVAALWNRGNVTAAMLGDVPLLISLVNKTFDAWDKDECPLCKQKVTVNTEVGKGREFLARHAST